MKSRVSFASRSSRGLCEPAHCLVGMCSNLKILWCLEDDHFSVKLHDNNDHWSWLLDLWNVSLFAPELTLQQRPPVNGWSLTVKYDVRITTSGSNEYLDFTLMEYFIHLKHSLKILYKSKHFTGRCRRKREWVFFIWTQCRYLLWNRTRNTNKQQMLQIH